MSMLEACKAQNEECFEVVIICSGRNVNEYRDYVADLVGERGGATFKVMPVCKGAVKDQNEKKKKNFKNLVRCFFGS